MDRPDEQATGETPGAPSAGAPRGAGAPADAARPADRPERVIRRAAEPGHSAGEERAGSLLPEVPEDDVVVRTLGRGLVRASRAVPGGRAEVQEKLEEHFRTREGLQAVRQRPGRSLWEPADGLLDRMRRAMDPGGRGYELAEARSVELSVSPLEEGGSLVALTLDARNVRSQHAVGWLAGSAPVWMFGFLVLEIGLGLPAVVSGPLAGAGVLGTGAAGGRWSFGKKRRRMQLVASGLLGRLEQGAPLEPDRPPGWRGRLPAGGRDR